MALSNPYKARSMGVDLWAIAFWTILIGWLVLLTGRGVHRRREERAFLRAQQHKQKAMDIPKPKESDTIADVFADNLGAAVEQAHSWLDEQAQEYNATEYWQAVKGPLEYGLDQIGDMADQVEDGVMEWANDLWEDDSDSDDEEENDESGEDDYVSEGEEAADKKRQWNLIW